MGKQVCGVKLMSPGGREVAPSGDEKEDAGPGLLTCACNALAKDSHLHVYVVFGQRVKEKVDNSAVKLNNNKNILDI